MTIKDIKAAFADISDDNVSYSPKNKTYTVRKGYYYRMGMSAEGFCKKVQAHAVEVGIEIEVTDFNEKWAKFQGGDSVKQGSHWWVTFKVINNA